MRLALLPLLVLFGCDDELVCEDGLHPVVDVCVADQPPTVHYPDSGGETGDADDTAGGDSGQDSGGGDSSDSATTPP
ncbi:MAG: hypothetical protein IPI35_14965 [Deltaproteobacteria bacterium]|jgi:hypothetical protein|nr:hypothetical protein [Deltaproteobacteria bacterium]